MEHIDIPAGEIHAAHNWAFADASARAAATGFVAGDVGKLALQLDDFSLWVLKATTPEWGSVGGYVIHTHAQYAEKRGLVQGQTTLAYNETTRTITITGTNFDVFVSSGALKKNTASLQHPDVQGGHFFFYDEAGNFVTSQTPWDLTLHAPVAFVFWDATNKRGIPFEERHNAGRDVYWHRNQHINEGTKVSSGFAASGYTINLQSDAGVTLAIATGRVEDEDIRIDTVPLPDAGPYTIIERVGVSGDWQITRTSALPFLYTGTNLQYNQNNGGTWQRTNVPNTDFINVWVFAATALNGQDQYIFVPGQAEFGTANLANADVVSNIAWGTLPFQEIAPLYRLTYQFGNGYSGTARCRLTDIVRVIGTAATVTQATAADHGSMTGLADDDHPQYAMTNPDAQAVSYQAGGTTTITLDGRDEDFHATAATGVTTWAFSGAAASGKVSAFTLELTNGGSQTQTWPASVKWDGGTAPTLTAAGLDILTFYTRDGGTTWRGFLAAADSK